MSGPWDRPSPDPDAEWPSEDLGSPQPSERRPADQDPWASGDLWPETRRGAAPEWDDWPSTAPPDDRYLAEPAPVLSDPWSESWADESPTEAPDVPSRRTEEDGRTPEPAERSWDRDDGPVPVAAEPAVDRVEPAGVEATEGADWREHPDSMAEAPFAPQASPPPLQPWSPDVDPWASAEQTVREPEPELVRERPAEGEPEGKSEAPSEGEPEVAAEPELQRSDDAFDEPVVRSWPWSREQPAPTELDWLPDLVAPPSAASLQAPPVPEAPLEVPEADDQAAHEEPEAAIEPAVAPPEADAAEADHTTDDAIEVDEIDEVDEAADDADAAAPAATSPWVARWFARRAGIEPSGDEATVAEPEDRATSAADADGGTAPLEPVDGEGEGPTVAGSTPSDDLADAALELESAPAPVEGPDAPPTPRTWAPIPSPPPPWARDEAPEPAVAATVEAELSREPEPAPDPEPAWRGLTSTEVPEPELTEAPPPAWADDTASPRVSESTQVLPTDWEPAIPPPPARHEPHVLEPAAGTVRTRLAEPETDAADGAEPRPSTAEQAVPWLIGFILLLAGMVIVLLALIFAGDESLGGGAPSPSPTNAVAIAPESQAATLVPSPSAPAAPTTAPTPAVATPTPVPAPSYGPLEVVYQGRAAALAPIFLLRRDFTVEAEADVLAQDSSLDVRRFAWAPDGTVGAGLLADVLVSIEPGAEKRRLGDGISTVTFGTDATTVYAVRVTQDGANDVANVLAIDFGSGDVEELAVISYPRPSIGTEAALTEAQFEDDGGPIRLFWMEDDVLRLWALGGGTWHIDPTSGDVSALDEEALPTLWAPRGSKRIAIEVEAGDSRISLLDDDGEVEATTALTGLISHVRWSPDGERVMFTLGRSAAGGGILQDLFLWDLVDGQTPTRLTSSGAAFGAEWLGTMAVWRE